uniref:Uncharacterized protein n=1 Tax=Cavia porcellus TaxID=10141 RepID=H0WDJ5_CAVPO
MNHSSKAKGLNVPKSDKQHSKKSHTAHLPQVSKAEEIPAQEDISARKIQRAWFMHLDKVIFQLLKHTICAAEYCVTHEILKNVSPSEAKLTKDPSMKCKVRFRFSGETFPPFIVFKIFLHTEGHGYKYFSGKNLFKPSSKAVIDACKMMGRQKFYEQIMEDERLFQKFKVTDHVDIVTTQDYMQQPQTAAPPKRVQETTVFSSPSFNIVKYKEFTSSSDLKEEEEEEEKEVFAWYQQLYHQYFP